MKNNDDDHDVVDDDDAGSGGGSLTRRNGTKFCKPLSFFRNIKIAKMRRKNGIFIIIMTPLHFTDERAQQTNNMKKVTQLLSFNLIIFNEL